jgi:hypothetical protein
VCFETDDSSAAKVTFLLSWFALGFTLWTTAGCGSGTAFPMDRVEGRVRYEGGSLVPSPSIIVRFEPLRPPIDAKTHPKAGMAKVDPRDGSFKQVTTYKFGDGIVRGRHKVLLSDGTAAAGPEDDADKSLIPQEYRDGATTPLEVDSRDSPFTFEIPKP